jgi:hypothetical protein
MDAADWLLNLLFRRWLAYSCETWAEGMLQQAPVMRRSNETQRCELQLRSIDDRQRMPPFVGGFLDLLSDPPTVPSGISPLTVEAFYFFERRLPANLRAFAVEAAERTHRAPDDPAAFFGRLDHAFSPQFLGRFVRVDLSQPDDLLIEDLRDYLKRERAELAKLPGPQPFRDSVARASKRKASPLKTMATIALLPYLDLNRWLKREGASMSQYALADAIGIEPKRLTETAQYAGMVFDDMALRAWLGAKVRGIRPRSQRRRRV